MPPALAAARALPAHDHPVNVVKPLQRDHEPPPGSPSTILDPKFSRALDFKLRRLKQKELIQTDLRRNTRAAPRAQLSEPKGGSGESHTKARNHSQSCIDISAGDAKISPTMERSPDEGRRSRVRSEEKPRFVTTVRCGQFLLPPPEVASLLGLEALYPARPEPPRVVYSYASRPKPVPPRAPGPAGPRVPGPPPVPRVPGPPPVPVPPRPAAALLGSVRALVASVAGFRHGTDHNHSSGSVGAAPYFNVMHDKRVVRGSTYGAHPHAAGDGVESAASKAARTRRRALARRAAAARLRPASPPPAPGRRHHLIQTEHYLEELFDKGVEMEVGVQTDLFVDRPATPVYVPAKTGADAFTQIYPGDLFDFDLEVQPILEVLVGGTTERALAEVAQEEELCTLREQQRRYRELRDAECAERQRLAAQELRLHGEKERRVAEARGARRAAGEARARAAAAALVQGYVGELLPAVLAGLRAQGYLLERVGRGVEEEFGAWLVAQVAREVRALGAARGVLGAALRDAAEARAALHRGAAERPAAQPEPDDSLTPPSLVSGEHEEEPEEE